MVNDEVKFAKILEDIKYVAKAQGGYIAEEDVYEAFEELNLSKDQFELVFDYLYKNKIGINEPVNLDEYLSTEEKSMIEEYKEELRALADVDSDKLRAYVMQAMTGDTQACDVVLRHYLPQVVEISKIYSSQGTSVEDLIGEGNLALAKGVKMLGALESPDEAEGMLIKLIMDAMEELIKETYESAEEDEKLANKVNEVADEARKLAEELGHKVTVDELVNEKKLSRKKIMEAIRLSANKIEDIDYQDETT